jgi:hypothetical protein
VRAAWWHEQQDEVMDGFLVEPQNQGRAGTTWEPSHEWNLADVVMANAIANGLMQHPEVPQDSHSVSSDMQGFLRAEAPLLPWSCPSQRVPMLAESSQSGVKIIYVLMMTLPQKIGCKVWPPSVLWSFSFCAHAYSRLGHTCTSILASAPMKQPLPVQSWNFVLASSFAGTWFLRVDNPNWCNNAEASTSSGLRRPRPQLIQPTQPRTEDQTVPS